MNRRLLLAFIVTSLTGCNSDRIAELEKQNQELTAKLDAAIKSVGLTRQQQCSTQANKMFKDWGWGKEGSMDAIANHYSARFGRCFMEIVSTDVSTKSGGHAVTVTKLLFDAFEEKQYGEYDEVSVDRNFLDNLAATCYVLSAAGRKQNCHSSDEFDELAKLYLEQ